MNRVLFGPLADHHSDKKGFLSAGGLRSPLFMPQDALAFLCACETAKGDEMLPDEATSLGGKFTVRWVPQCCSSCYSTIYVESLFLSPILILK